MKQKANKSAREPSAKPRRVVDWSLIKREYEVGQLSIRAIGRLYSITEGAIRKKVKKYGWKQDLAAKVRERIKEEIVRTAHEPVRSAYAQDPDADKTQEQIEADRAFQVEVAATRGVQIVREHRATLGQLRNVCRRLLDRLNRYLDDPQGFDLEQQPFIGPKENLSDVMLRCAQAGAKFIPLERRAYNLDEESGGEAYEDVLRALLDGKRG